MLAASDQTLFERLATPVRFTSLDLRCTFANQAWRTLCGPTTEPRQPGWPQWIHPDEVARCVETFHAHATLRTPYALTYRLRTHDGTYRRVTEQSTPWADQAGCTVGFVSTCLVADATEVALENVSERANVTAVAAGQDPDKPFWSERKYQQIVESTIEGIWAIDADGITTFVNAPLAQMLGYSVRDMVGRHVFDFIEEDTRRDAGRHLEHRRQGVEERYDFRFRKKDGSEMWALLSTLVETDATGAYLGSLAWVTDITDRKLQEEELREAKVALEHALDGVSKLDAHGRYVALNDAYADVVGYSPSEMIGLPWEANVHPDDHESMRQAYARMVAEGKARFEAKGVRKDGTIFYLLATLVSRSDANGAFGGHYCFLKNITERRNAQTDLQKTLAWQQAVLDSANLSIVSTSLDGTIQAFNSTAERWLGYAAEEIVGRYTPALFHDEVEVAARRHELSAPARERLRALEAQLGRELPRGVDALIAGPCAGVTDENEWSYVRKDGSRFPVRLSVSGVRDDAERLMGFLGVAVDLTAKKNAEAALQKAYSALQKSEERFRAAAEERPDGLCLLTAVRNPAGTACDFRFEFVNEPAARLLGRTRENLVAQSLFELYPADHPPDLRAHYVRVLETRRSFEDEFLARSPELGGRWLNVQASPMGDGIAVSMRDVTDRRLAEQERLETLRRTSEAEARAQQYRLIAETIPQIVWSTGPDGTLDYVNQRWTDFSGLTLDQTIAATAALIHPDDRNASACKRWEALRQGSLLEVEQRIRGKNGSYRWFLVRATPVRDESGQVVGWFGTSTDIEDKKRAEATAKEAQDVLESKVRGRTRQLQASLQEKEVLLREVHHRVKNNLQVICSLLNLQADQVCDPNMLRLLVESQNRVRAIASAHERLYQSKDLASINIAEHLREVAQGLLRTYGASANAGRVTVDVENVLFGIDTAIPCGLIVNELLSNALKHAYPDGKGRGVSICLVLATENKYELKVRDYGVGLPAGFELQRVSSMGLRLVRTLARQLRGGVSVNVNGAESGACFQIVFTPKPHEVGQSAPA